MILLRLISWPYARKHLARWILTLAGIVLGVGVFVGMHAANQSVLAAFHETIDQVAGKSQIQVTASEAGFNEDVLEKIQNVSEVRAAAPVIEATVATDRGNLLILGVDMLGDRSLRTYDLEGTDTAIDDPLVFLAQADSLMVSKTFADKNGLAINSSLPMKTMQGDRTFTVRGIMKPGGLASAFGGDLAIMDIYAAQKFLGRGRKFDRIDIALNEDVLLAQGVAKLRAALGDGFEIGPPSSRSEQFEQTSRTYTLASNITSIFALFIGVFIIYNTFAVAVTQRRNEIGILRALGAERRQIRTLFITESLVAGLLGSTLGVLFGMLLARGMAGYIGGVLTDTYGVAQRGGEVELSPWLLFGSLAMGVVTSLIAAVIPARTAAMVDPVMALQKGRQQAISKSESDLRQWAAMACAAAAALALLFSRNSVVFYVGFLLTGVAAILLSPAMAVWVTRALTPLLAWIRPVEGRLAADSLLAAPRRTSGTVAALMLSLSLVISLAGLSRASYVSLSNWMSIALNPDLFVTTAENVTARSFVFPASLGDGLRKITGVEEIQLVRSVRVQVKGAPVMLIALEIESVERRAKLPAVEGDVADMYRRTGRGEAVMISENFARLRGSKLGEILEIPTPDGVLKLPIVGIVRDFSDQQGSILISRQAYIQAFRDDTVNVFRLYLKPGADSVQVRQNILDTFGTKQRLFVLTNKDLRDYVNRLTDQWFGLTYIQIAVAVLVAILGIVNTLTVSITDRRRELGVLQAVGGLRNQVRRTIWMEAAAIGAIGLVLGLILGAIELYYGIEISRRDLTGIDIGYSYPWATAAIIAPVIMIAAFVAAIAPAEAAVRGSLVEALEYE